MYQVTHELLKVNNAESIVASPRYYFLLTNFFLLTVNFSQSTTPQTTWIPSSSVLAGLNLKAANKKIVIREACDRWVAVSIQKNCRAVAYVELAAAWIGPGSGLP